MRHKFVDFIPEAIEDGIIYISLEYCTCIHKCCCGCGREVVTPLSPTDWKVTFDGKTVSLFPSIGNWSFPCQSHYWIKNNRIEWAGQWSREQINKGKQLDLSLKQDYYQTLSEPVIEEKPQKEKNWWSFFKTLFGKNISE